MYYVGDKKYDYNSSKNQEIKRRFVNQHIFYSITLLANDLFGNNLIEQKPINYYSLK